MKNGGAVLTGAGNTKPSFASPVEIKASAVSSTTFSLMDIPK